MNTELERIRSIKSFPSLVKYLREELDWKIDDADIDDLTFDYEPDELGLDKETAVKIKEIKQLRPLVSNQPWGIFYISFEKKRLPIVALRRILRSLVLKKRASANLSEIATWNMNDLLFISSYGEEENRELSFAHFAENETFGDLPTLKVLGWNSDNTKLRLEDTVKTLKEKLHWVDNEEDIDAWRIQWSSAFKLQYRETVRTSKELAVRLADLAIIIRNRVNEVLKIESERGELRKLLKAFQEALIHDLSPDDFADMYAQTIAYGLLSARISRQSGALVADNISDLIPNTNPFLKELMQTFLTVGGRKSMIDFDELGINEVVELLRNANMEEVLRDFGAKNPNEDPVIHFYELFLKEYDPEKRMKRGVFYTPKPVVSFIVRSVHEILQKEFGLADGLADTTTWGEMKTRNKDLEIPEGVKETAPFVQILDPATGTGTFLVEVIDVIYKTMTEKWKSERKGDNEIRELWNEYVPKHLLPRLFGFELMMAPYSIAHMKIGLKLSETGYRFLSSERAQIYLTNTLEEPKDFSDYFVSMAPALAHEAEAANRVKRETPITAIVGNPPYAQYSSNLTSDAKSYIEKYRFANGTRIKARNALQLERNLNDDYVKFFGWCTSHLETIAVLCLITNRMYLDSSSLVGLRQNFTENFNVEVLDLHGSMEEARRIPSLSGDQNVFEITQGVSIAMLWRNEGLMTNVGVHFGDIVGTTNEKLVTLSEHTLASLSTRSVNPQSPFWWLSREHIEEVEEKTLGEIFLKFSTLVASNRDNLVVDFDKQSILERLEDFKSFDGTNEELCNEFDITLKKGWNLTAARRALNIIKDLGSYIRKIEYRALDRRFTFFSSELTWQIAPVISSNVIGKPFNLILISLGKNRGETINGQWVSKEIADKSVVSSRDNASGFPLYLYPTERERNFGATERVPNFSDDFIKELSEKLGLEFKYEVGMMNDESKTNSVFSVHNSSVYFSPEDVFHYAYAIFHSPTYRARYAEFLKIDFPRFPLTTDRELFCKLCGLGADLVALHLLDPGYNGTSWKNTGKLSPTENHSIKLQGSDDAVAAGHPKKELAEIDENGIGKVYINKTSYFAGVPEEVWNFHIGGYQVCHKWLKDRKGRTLSTEDQIHYNKIVIALRETIRLMAEIDEVINEHGGFPLVGSQPDETV